MSSTSAAEEDLPRPVKQSGRFMNPWLKDGRDPCEKRLGDVVQLLRDAPPVASQASQGTMAVAWDELRAIRDRKEPRPVMVWLGHASVLGIYRGQLLLFDPVFSERCSPFSFIGPKRFTPCPIKADLGDWPEDLAPDVVAISHAHYDHLDEATVRQIHARFPSCTWMAPLGLGKWFSSRGIEINEVDWWQELPLQEDLAMVALPAQHWANRWPWDRNTTLWCGFGLIERSEQVVKDMPLCFVGDTGYCPVFQLIGSKYRVQMAAVPIGAYHPRWFMSASHCDPTEAVQIVKDLNASAALAIHWGTFPLTAESGAAQLGELKTARLRSKDQRLRALPSGGHMSLDTLGADVADTLESSEGLA